MPGGALLSRLALGAAPLLVVVPSCSLGCALERLHELLDASSASMQGQQEQGAPSTQAQKVAWWKVGSAPVCAVHEPAVYRLSWVPLRTF